MRNNKKLVKKTSLGIIFVAVIFSITFINTGNFKNSIDYSLVNETSSQDPTRLVYGTNRGPVYLDPHYAWDSASWEVIDQVVETLYAYDLSDPELPIIPRLASDFGTWSDEGFVYTVPLRTGVTFHDGARFNATSVKWNFDRLTYFMNLDVPTQIYTLYLWDYGPPIINSVEVIDEYFVKFELNKPFAPFEDLLCCTCSGIMSPKSTPQEEYIDTATGDLIGTGPFVYDNYIDSEVKMHSYQNYWAGVSHIDELRFSIIRDTNVRNQALLDGNIDFIKTPENSFLNEFRDHPDINLVDAGQGTTIWYLGMNNKKINLIFRKAISYAIDYSYIIDVYFEGEAVRLKSPIPLGLKYANWEFNVPIFNLTQARKVMQSMGYGLGWDVTPGGIHEVFWISATFKTLHYTYNLGNNFREDMLIPLQNCLKRIGIEVLDDGVTTGEFFRRIFNEKDLLELYWLGWGPDYDDPFDNINFLFSKNSDYNTAQVDNEGLQGLMEAALLTRDPAERKFIYDNIQHILIEAVFPMAWGFVSKNYDAYNRKSTGFQSNPMDKLWFHTVRPQSPEIALEYIQSLPNDAFWFGLERFRQVLTLKLEEVSNLIDAGNYQDAINKLKRDIRTKCDGRNIDWVTDPEAQQELCAMIDSLILYLRSLIS